MNNTTNAAKRPSGLRACADGFNANPDKEFALKCMRYAADQMEELETELTAVTEQRDDFKKELEIANLRLKGKRHPDDNGIMADGEIDVKALTEQRDRLEEAMQTIIHIYENPDKSCIPCSSDMYDESLQSIKI